jgi:hypothetical protein
MSLQIQDLHSLLGFTPNILTPIHFIWGLRVMVHGFQYISSAPVLHYLQAVFFFIKI